MPQGTRLIPSMDNPALLTVNLLLVGQTRKGQESFLPVRAFLTVLLTIVSGAQSVTHGHCLEVLSGKAEMQVLFTPALGA